MSGEEPSPAVRQDMAEAVKEDPDLLPEEKEFSLSFAKGQDRASVYTDIGSVVRRLLAHPHFAILDLRVSDAERFGAVLSWQEWQTDGAPITGVRGNIPIGCLKVSGRPRANNYPTHIVSDYAPESPDGTGGGST